MTLRYTSQGCGYTDITKMEYPSGVTYSAQGVLIQRDLYDNMLASERPLFYTSHHTQYKTKDIIYETVYKNDGQERFESAFELS